jgi:PIN domain nuclease of toxin-antitoxin system
MIKNGQAMKRILLDTHVALWSAEGQLNEASTAIVEEAVAGRRLLLSPITAWEIALLISKKRLQLPRETAEFIRGLFASDGVVLAALTPAVAVAAAGLRDLHADPADRFLVATAAEYDAHLMTRDKRILDYAKATKHIRCIAC